VEDAVEEGGMKAESARVLGVVFREVGFDKELVATSEDGA
jgi:hypothetical protein